MEKLDIEALKKKLSVIVPFYNEESNLNAVIERIKNSVEKTNVFWEILLIDNCSTDSSFDISKKSCELDQRIKLVRFSRNFGPSVEASIAAGFDLCTGDAAIVIYSDLQDPPELIPRFLKAWENGADVVYGVQTARQGDPKWRNFLVNRFYKFLEKISDTPIHPKSGDFKLVSRKVIDLLNTFPEKARFSRGLISWIGFTSVPVYYSREPRKSGKSKSNFWAISFTALTAITAFSLKPLRLLTIMGFILFLSSIIGILTVLFFWVYGQTVPGMTSVIVLLLMLIGVNMGSIGLLGEYVGRIQMEVKSRPLYIINQKINLDN